MLPKRPASKLCSVVRVAAHANVLPLARQGDRREQITERQPTPCGTPKQIEVERGRFEGAFDFRGEEGYTRARVTRVSASARVALSLICGGESSEGFGGHSPGARLTIHRKAGGEITELVARKNSPTRPARFQASVEELTGRVKVSRAIWSTAPPVAFQFAFPAKTATVAPGGPFYGTATYDGGQPKFNRVSGDLAADFPGHSGVPLVGTHARAGMIRYVDNPSHPFALPAADALRVPRLGAWLSTKP